MNEVFDRIEKLCKGNGLNITKMCKLCDIPRASLSDFKMGRIKSLSAETLRKIAEYFSVSVEYLLSGELYSFDERELKVALFGQYEGVTDEMLLDVKRYAQALLEKEQEKEF